jgi:hypothetical protein
MMPKTLTALGMEPVDLGAQGDISDVSFESDTRTSFLPMYVQANIRADFDWHV